MRVFREPERVISGEFTCSRLLPSFFRANGEGDDEEDDICDGSKNFCLLFAFGIAATYATPTRTTAVTTLNSKDETAPPWSPAKEDGQKITTAKRSTTRHGTVIMASRKDAMPTNASGFMARVCIVVTENSMFGKEKLNEGP